jgi:hypothetical protein
MSGNGSFGPRLKRVPLGVRSLLMQIERQVTQIDLYRLMQIADLLDVSLDWLLGRKDTPEI